MTQYTHTAEGGTDGGAVTAGNSGGASGNAFTLVQLAGAASATYSTVGKAHGSLGYRVQSLGGSTDRFYLQTNVGGTGLFSGRIYFTLNALPSQAQNVFRLTGSSGSANLMAVGLLAGNTMRVIDAAGATLGSYATALTAGASYRLEYAWAKGTGTTDGQIAAKLFAGESQTPLYSYASTSVNAGTVNPTQMYIGAYTSANVLDMTVDTILYDDSVQTFLGPLAVPPTNAVVPSTVISGTGWTAVGASDIPAALADGLDSSYAQSPDSPTNSTLIVSTSGNLADGNVVVTPRMSKRDSTTTATAVVTLLDSNGNPVAAAQTYTLTTSPKDYPYSLSSAENAALTNRSGLQWRIVASA